MAKKCCVIHREIIDVFHDKILHYHNRKPSFHLAHVRIIDSMEYGKTRNDLSMIMHQKKI